MTKMTDRQWKPFPITNGQVKKEGRYIILEEDRIKAIEEDIEWCETHIEELLERTKNLDVTAEEKMAKDVERLGKMALMTAEKTIGKEDE